MYVLCYASMLRCWHLVWILVRTDRPSLGVGYHRWALLNWNIVLNCSGSSRRFSSQYCKIESMCLLDLQKCSIHDFLLNRMAYYSRYVTRMKKVVCGVSKCLNPFKIKLIWKWNLFPGFLIQSPEGFGSWDKQKSCPLWCNLSPCNFWNFFELSK
jgi:hypothetical protein